MAAAQAAVQTVTGLLPVGEDRRLYYSATVVNPEAPVVLLSNPICTTLDIWDPVVPQLTAMGLNVLRYNAPGHGQSLAPQDLSSTTFDSLAHDVTLLLDGVNIPTLHAWIGVGLGAATAIVFTSRNRHRVDRLIVCDTIACSPINGGTVDIFGPSVAAVRQAGNVDALIDETMESWFGQAWMELSPVEAQRVRYSMQDTTVDGFETCCAALRSASFDLRGWATSAGTHIKSALFLVGEKDVGVFEAMEEIRKDVQGGLINKKRTEVSVPLDIVQGGGHACFVDGFTSFIDLITPILQTPPV